MSATEGANVSWIESTIYSNRFTSTRLAKHTIQDHRGYFPKEPYKDASFKIVVRVLSIPAPFLRLPVPLSYFDEARIMAGPSLKTPLPHTGIIKVYSAKDDSHLDGTNPRHIHLHKKIPSGATVCCHPFTAGGIVRSSIDALHFLTSDRFVPPNVDPHTDTDDKACACVGYVRCVYRKLHFALVSIKVAVEDNKTVEQASGSRGVPASMSPVDDVVMDPIMIRDLHRRHDANGLALLARTRHNKVIRGRITVLPHKAVDPSRHLGTRLVLAQFDPALGCMDVGMWVYAKQPEVEKREGPTGGSLAGPDNTPRNCPQVSDSRCDSPCYNLHYVPLLLVGHVVEICGRGPDGRVEVAIQCAHEVLSKISAMRDRLSGSYCSRCPPLVCA
ncbi:uncharacterized protein F4812DRAFT_416791 [Daldinia caldariorum]|uniref:uncharacterized protein n=1 Tax=Daldinia caldariorum TaxID=326644 RepID=UPI0020074FA4|nr:uncharacterized protein F4812DRAFT_416791 [Daldinia caldariorum]KAI1470254.1 hypothetical protein F4812DRAFT_416791 [Daldinia caldariorum]